MSGNCSLYNETNGEAIPPTPAIGGVGLMPDVDMMATIALKREGDVLILIGEEAGHLGQSLYLQVMLNRKFGAPPPVDLDAESRNGDFVRGLIEAEHCRRCTTCPTAGSSWRSPRWRSPAVMALRSTRRQFRYPHAVWFGEDQARYVIAAAPDKADAIHKAAAAAKVPLQAARNGRRRCDRA